MPILGNSGVELVFGDIETFLHCIRGKLQYCNGKYDKV